MRNIAKTAIALTIMASAIVAASAPSAAVPHKGWHQQNQSSTFVQDSVPRDRGANS